MHGSLDNDQVQGASVVASTIEQRLSGYFTGESSNSCSFPMKNTQFWPETRKLPPVFIQPSYTYTTEPLYNSKPDFYTPASGYNMSLQTQLSETSYSLHESAVETLPQAPKSKKRRGNLPKKKTDILKLWFDAHSKSPYPNEKEKQELMNQTSLSKGKLQL